ncbi:N-lysine methyltransferase KMT5A-A-like, partial [Plectropomus leopardus]|uniref:N-lysine methyltransferase KMT5A-A-like n=1 Tax=Plectropomus leopardus TaxID=160734 RepID=UPI001C4B9233
MEVQHIEGKGRAVFATRCFQKGEYVVEYHGDLLQITDAKKREAEYAQNPATGCYMYYFQFLCKTYWYEPAHVRFLPQHLHYYWKTHCNRQ